MKYRFAAILISLVFNSIAQVNLVPNPSFEEYSQCPTGAGQLSYSIGWSSPSNGSSDYFNSCSLSNTIQTPINHFGEQIPFDGQGYIGINLYHNIYLDNREYAQCTLISDLVQGKFYCVSLHVSLAGRQVFSITDDVGVYFSAFAPTNFTPGFPPATLLNITPQIKSLDFIDDTTNWVNLNSIYQASGGEKYLTIGNFNIDGQTTLLPSDYPQGDFIYLYIDNVSVVECDTTLSPIAPKIFTPNSDGINDIFQIEYLPANSKLAVYNRWGGTVYQSDNYQNNWDGQNHSPGVYYYILTLPSGNTKKGTVTLLRD